MGLTTRAVARLLIDDATGQPVLFVDASYGTNDNSEASLVSAATVCDQAAEIGTILNVPVIYSSPLPDSNYAMSGSEYPAVMWQMNEVEKRDAAVDHIDEYT